MQTNINLTINRSMVLLRYQQPFLDWICSVEPDLGPAITLESINEDGDAFLLPTEPVINDSEEAVGWIEKRWQGFFEQKLADWYTDEALWPKKRSLKMFREWFVVDYHSMVWDLDTAPLEYEDWSEEADA